MAVYTGVQIAVYQGTTSVVPKTGYQIALYQGTTSVVPKSRPQESGFSPLKQRLSNFSPAVFILVVFGLIDKFQGKLREESAFVWNHELAR